MQTAIDYQMLAAAMFNEFQGGRLKAVSSTPSNIYGHGPGGLFSMSGLNQEIFNAMLLPHLGIQSRLPYRATKETNPIYAIMTGNTASSGSNPTGECDDPKTAGLMKLCHHTAVFGRLSMQTRVFNLEHMGEITNRGEETDLRLMGNPFTNAQVPTTGATASNAINNEVNKALHELASSWAIDYAPLLYAGNPTNNTSGGGYKEFRGLDLLINTGYKDAETNVACRAADSVIISFGNRRVENANADIVGVIQGAFFRLRHIATRAGLGNVKWVISMPYGMFHRLSEVWAYYYVTRALNGLTFDASVQITHGGDKAVEMRDQFRGNLETREGQFLLVDGVRVDVVLDDAIAETEVTPGVFEGDIYIVPLTVLGGTPVTYMEYFDYSGSMEAAAKIAPADSYYTSDGNMYFWHKKPPTNLCTQLALWTRPRLIMRTPYIAARITNVAWTPLTEHERSPFTSSSYHVNGGGTSRLGWGPSWYVTP